jgi:membrane protease subunit HflC
MKLKLGVVLWVVIVVGFFVALASFYTLQETEQAIITEFGKPVGQPVINHARGQRHRQADLGMGRPAQ